MTMSRKKFTGVFNTMVFYRGGIKKSYLYFLIIGLIFFHNLSSFLDLVVFTIKSPTNNKTATPPFLAIHLASSVCIIFGFFPRLFV